ncbi:hypothetical protein [Thermoflexus sp.]|uniref:hypothetical protein n=1 Tax=Thermoflexus sp. TaxID=1969742 RepID=UPI002627E1F0|nr:hypothetical protein [Thermoflexus sp.]MCX7689927.1 hypothetical protein [Thermoflexus sp.]
MRRSALPIGLLISAYLMASLFYNVTIPPWEAPDEVGHFLYIVHILQTRSLPRMEIGQLGQAHQPPLYLSPRRPPGLSGGPAGSHGGLSTKPPVHLGWRRSAER